jgi:hypothetical protein
LHDSIGALARILGCQGVLREGRSIQSIGRRRRRTRRGVPTGRTFRRRSGVRSLDELKAERDVFGKGRGLGKSEVVDASLETKGVRRRVRRNRVDRRRRRVRRRERRTTISGRRARRRGRRSVDLFRRRGRRRGQSRRRRLDVFECALRHQGL